MASTVDEQGAVKKAPLRERKRAATRSRIHRVAVEFFLARGFANVSVEEIAGAADVAPRTFFRYFPVKEDAVLAMNGDMMRALREALAGADRAKPALIQVRDAFAEALRFLFAASLPGMGELIAREPAIAERLEHYNLEHEAIVAAYLEELAGGGTERRLRARFFAAAVLAAMTHARREVIAGHGARGEYAAAALEFIADLQLAWDATMMTVPDSAKSGP